MRGHGCALFYAAKFFERVIELKENTNKNAAFKRLAELECELLDRLKGDDLKLLNDLIEAWTEYADSLI